MNRLDNPGEDRKPLEFLSQGHAETTKVSEEIGKSLTEKDKILEMIGDIEDGDIRKALENSLKYVSSEYVLREISIYYEEVEPRLEEYESGKLYSLCLKGNKMLPSQISRELSANEEINKEQDLNVRALMDLSYGKRLPSEIFEDRDVYLEFSQITDDEESAIVKRCLGLGLAASVVKEYQLSSYHEIKDISDDNVKKMMLICVNKGYTPSIIQDYQVYFESAVEYGKENVERVLKELSQLTGNESYETLAYICSKNIYQHN